MEWITISDSVPCVWKA